MTDLLGPLYMGALDPAESDAVDGHLRDCAECRAAAREVVEVVAALALVEAGAESAPDRPVKSVPGRGPSAPRPMGPPGRTASSGPAGRPRSRRQRIGLLRTALALAVVLFVGFGTLFVVDRVTGNDTSSAVTVAVTASATGTGTSATVLASETESGVHLRVTVTGLHTGTAYQLSAVTSNGQAYDVSRWKGSAEVQDISGDAPGELGDLAFVTISIVGGPPAVTVHLNGIATAAPR